MNKISRADADTMGGILNRVGYDTGGDVHFGPHWRNAAADFGEKAGLGEVVQVESYDAPVIAGTDPGNVSMPFDVTPVDARSEGMIATLNPVVQPLARGLIHMAAEVGITMIVTSAYRTYAEQETLYEAHLRGGPQAVAPGHSYHNFALAFDVTKFVNGQPVWESPDYMTVAKMAGAIGLVAGALWKTGQDEPHYEYHPYWAGGMSETDITAELRDRKAKGRDLLA